MTISIAAWCSRTGQAGAAAVTAMMGVGKLVTHAMAGVGAVTTHAMINPYLGFEGLRLLEAGASAQAALDRLIERDPARDLRQCGIVDRHGVAASWTGPITPDWSGHRTQEHLAVQGNRLAGPEVVDAAVETFLRTDGEPLSERLVRALEAAEAKGGDRKGAVSAAVYVMGAEEYPLWDLRVDHAQDAIAALRDLYKRAEEELLPTVRRLPTRDDWVGSLAREALESLEETGEAPVMELEV